MDEIEDAVVEMIEPQAEVAQEAAPELVWINVQEELPPQATLIEVITQSRMPAFMVIDEKGEQQWRPSKDYRQEVITHWRKV